MNDIHLLQVHFTNSCFSILFGFCVQAYVLDAKCYVRIMFSFRSSINYMFIWNKTKQKFFFPHFHSNVFMHRWTDVIFILFCCFCSKCYQWIEEKKTNVYYAVSVSGLWTSGWGESSSDIILLLDDVIIILLGLNSITFAWSESVLSSFRQEILTYITSRKSQAPRR